MQLRTMCSLSLLVISFNSFSQNWSDSGKISKPNPFAPGVTYRFVGGDSGTLIGTGSGKPALPPYYVRKLNMAVFRYDKQSGRLWLYRPETGEYDSTAFSGGGNAQSASTSTFQQTIDASANAEYNVNGSISGYRSFRLNNVDGYGNGYNAVIGSDFNSAFLSSNVNDAEQSHIAAKYDGDGGGIVDLNATGYVTVSTAGNIYFYSGQNRYYFNNVQYAFPVANNTGCLVNDGQGNLDFKSVILPDNIEHTNNTTGMQLLYIDANGKVWKH